MLNTEKQGGNDGKIYLLEAIEGFCPEGRAPSKCLDGWFLAHGSGDV